MNGDENESTADLRAELAESKARVAELEAEKTALLGRPEPASDDEPRKHRSHHVAVALLLLAGLILTPIAILALFVRNEISDTGRYVATVKPLSSNPAIQSYVADDVSQQLFERVDIDHYVRDALPKRARPLAGPLTSALQGFVHAAVLRIIETDQFQQLWIDANRLAHEQLVSILEGKESGTVTATANGAVTVDLSQVTKLVAERLQSSGLDVFSNIPIAGIGGKITVFKSKDLYKVRSAVGWFEKIAFVLPFLVFGCFGAAIYLSRNRRRAFVQAAIAFTAGAVILFILLAVGRGLYLNAATGRDLPYDAAAAMYDTLLRYLHTAVRAVLFFSIIVVVAVFFAGPSRLAVWFRDRVHAGAVWLGNESQEAGWTWLGTNSFVSRYQSAFRIATAIVAFAVLFRTKHPTPMLIFWVAVATLAVLGLIEFFGRGEPEPSAPATPVGEAS